MATSSYYTRPVGDQIQVVENDSHLIIRTLDTRSEAEAFVAALSHNPKARR